MFEDAEGDVEKLAHSGADGAHFGFAGSEKPQVLGANDWVKAGGGLVGRGESAGAEQREELQGRVAQASSPVCPSGVLAKD